MSEIRILAPEEELERAARAEQILGDDLFKDAVRRIESALLDGIRRSAFVDARLREKLCARYALLQDLVGELRGVMETGRLAEETIKQRSFMERAKQAFRETV